MATMNEAMQTNEAVINDRDEEVTFAVPDISCLETFARFLEVDWNTMSIDDAWAQLSAWSGPAAGPISGLSTVVACCVDSFKSTIDATTLRSLKAVFTHCALHNAKLGHSKADDSSAWCCEEQCNLLVSAFLSSQFLLQGRQDSPMPSSASSSVHQAALSCLISAGTAAINAMVSIEYPHLHEAITEVVSRVVITQLFLPTANVRKSKPAGPKHAADKAAHLEHSSTQTLCTQELIDLAASLFLPSVARDNAPAANLPSHDVTATYTSSLQQHEWAAFERLAYDTLNAACTLGTPTTSFQSGTSNAAHIATAHEYVTSLLISLSEHDTQLCSHLLLGLGQVLQNSTGAWQPLLQQRLPTPSITESTNTCIMEALLQTISSTIQRLLEPNLAGLLLSCVSHHISSGKAATRKVVLSVAAVAMPSTEATLARNAASLLAQGGMDQDATVRLKAINSCILSLLPTWEQELRRQATGQHHNEAHDIFATYIVPCTCHRLLDTAKTVRVKGMQLLADILDLPNTLRSSSNGSKCHAMADHIKKEAARAALKPLCYLMDARQDSILWDESREKAVQALMSKVIHTLGCREMLTHALNSMMPAMYVHVPQVSHVVDVKEPNGEGSSQLQPHESFIRSLVHQCQPTDTSAAFSVWREFLSGLDEPHQVEYVADTCKGVPNQNAVRQHSFKVICQTLSHLTASAAEPGASVTQCHVSLTSLHTALKVLFCFSTSCASEVRQSHSHVASNAAAGRHHPDDSICEAAVLLDVAWALLSMKFDERQCPGKHPGSEQLTDAHIPRQMDVVSELQALHIQEPAVRNSQSAADGFAAGYDHSEAQQHVEGGTAYHIDASVKATAQKCLFWCFHTLQRNMPRMTVAVRQTNDSNNLLVGQLVSRSIGRMLAGPLTVYPLHIQDVAFKILCSCPGGAQGAQRLLRTLELELHDNHLKQGSLSQQQGTQPGCGVVVCKDNGLPCMSETSTLSFARYLTLIGHMTQLYEADRADFIARAMNTTHGQGPAVVPNSNKEESPLDGKNEQLHCKKDVNGDNVGVGTTRTSCSSSDYMAGEEAKQAIQEAAQKYLEESMQRSAPGTQVPLLVAVLQEQAGQDQHTQFLQVLALRALWRLMQLSPNLAQDHQKLLCQYVVAPLQTSSIANSTACGNPHKTPSSTARDIYMANNRPCIVGEVALMAEALQGAKALLIDNPNTSAALLLAIEELLAGLLQTSTVGTCNGTNPADGLSKQHGEPRGQEPPSISHGDVLLQTLAVYVEVLCSDKLQMKGCTWRLLGQCALCEDGKVQSLVIQALKHMLALQTMGTQGTHSRTAGRRKQTTPTGPAAAITASLASRQVQVLLALYSNCDESQRHRLVEQVFFAHGLLTEHELTADGLVIPVLQSLSLAETQGGRGAALAMLTHMTPSSKALAALSSMLQGPGLLLARMPQSNAQALLKALMAFVSRHKATTGGSIESGRASAPAIPQQQQQGNDAGQASNDARHNTPTEQQIASVSAVTAPKSVTVSRLFSQLQGLADNLKVGNAAMRPPLPRPPTSTVKQQPSQSIAVKFQAPSITSTKEISSSNVQSKRILRPRKMKVASKRKRVITLSSSSSESDRT